MVAVDRHDSIWNAWVVGLDSTKWRFLYTRPPFYILTDTQSVFTVGQSSPSAFSSWADAAKPHGTTSCHQCLLRHEQFSHQDPARGPSPETNAHLGTSNDEAPTWLQVVNGVFIQVLGWHHSFDHLLLQGLSHGIQGYVFVVLYRNDDGVDAHRDDRTIILRVLNCHLSIEGDAVRPRPELRLHGCWPQIPGRQVELLRGQVSPLVFKGSLES